MSSPHSLKHRMRGVLVSALMASAVIIAGAGVAGAQVVEDEPASLTVAVEGGDPVFSIEGPDDFADEIVVDEGEAVTLDDVAAGTYTITMIDPDDLVVDAIDCEPEATDVDLEDRSVTVEIGEGEDAVCTFTVSATSDGDGDNGYDDYPGDSDFDFDTPFDNADNDPAPVEVAATSEPVVAQQPAQPEVPVVVAGEVAPAAAPEAAPVVMTELPRTGAGARKMTLVGGLLLITGGAASLIARRRKATQA